MCCLRYEDQTYKELKSKLPNRNKRVGTAEGPGIVIDSKILVQLVLVRLEHDMREIAVPVEELMDPETCPRPAMLEHADAREPRGARGEGRSKPDSPRDRRSRTPSAVAKAAAEPPHTESPEPRKPDTQGAMSEQVEESVSGGDDGRKKKRRRKRRRKGKGAASDLRTPSASTPHAQQDAFRAMAQQLDAESDENGAVDAPDDQSANQQAGSPLANVSSGAGDHKRKRRRRRRRRGGAGGGNSNDRRPPDQSPPPSDI